MRFLKSVGICLVLAACSVSLSYAGDNTDLNEGDIEAGFFLGAHFPENYGPFNLKTSPIIGGRIGYFFTNEISVEGSYQHTVANTKNGFGANIDSIRLNGLYNFDLFDRFVPFVTAGFGWEFTEIGTFVDTNGYSINAGAGARWFLGNGLGMRVDGRFVHADVNDIIDEKVNNYELLVGLFFVHSMGKKQKSAYRPAPVRKVTEQKVMSVRDLDGDGVENKQDKCPDTPKGYVVDKRGCIGDADRDGLADDKDRCPNTPEGKKVDELGCAVDTVARGVLKGVNFELNSDELTSGAKAVLDNVARELKKTQGVTVEVQGHSDTMGDDNYNMDLSQKRAQSVKNYLQSKGVPGNMLSAKGYGETSPIADNETIEGREKNRRVELKWLE